MWHKAIWKGHPMRLELTRVGLLVELANRYTTRGAHVMAIVLNFDILESGFELQSRYYAPIDNVLIELLKIRTVLALCYGLNSTSIVFH